MSSSPLAEPSSPSLPPASSPTATSPPSPALLPARLHTSTPNYISKKPQQPPLSVVLPAPAPSTPPSYTEPALTPPPRSPAAAPGSAPVTGDARSPPPDGTSSDKSSETAVGVSRTPSAALSRKESYKAQRQHYRREKKRAASALLHSIEDPTVVVLADWLKVRGSLKSWTKLWCVLKPGLLLLYKSPKAKSSHWVGTVLLTSCRVIERPSKKDGFCFKLYHPLEQSIWAPRGPHNEAIGAVVQPLPTAHLIFRAPSQAAGHCWLDGLELALRCSNAMLRCSRARAEHPVPDAPTAAPEISNEELEKHFNEHVLKMAETTPNSPPPIMSVSDYTPSQTFHQTPKEPQRTKPRKLSKWAQFVESLDILTRDNENSSESISPDVEKHGFLDFLKRKDHFDRTSTYSSVKHLSEPKPQQVTSKSLASSPLKINTLVKKPLAKCFEMPKLPLHKDKHKENSHMEDNLFRLMTYLPRRRCSTPFSLQNVTQKRISNLRESGVKTDSENDDFLKCSLPKKAKEVSEVICATPKNFVITKTAPSVERFRKYSSSSTDEVGGFRPQSPYLVSPSPKYSLIDCRRLPSLSYEALRRERRGERNALLRPAGRVVVAELAGAASDSDSSGSPVPMAEPPDKEARTREVLARIRVKYTEDPDKDTGAAGELVEEVAEENKSLLWFLLKQVRPGMDLSKVVLPTFILEPRSFLDKLSDSYYHADILAEACTIEDPYLRFKCVLRWYLSGLYKKPKGLKKPYNPVLGETFRCMWKHPDSNTITYYIAEQVSHHPPVSAFYVSNRKEGFVIEGSLLARSKFYGNSTSAILEGCARVHLLPVGETYVTTAPYAHCKGIVIGTLSMELGGKVQIKCAETGYSAEVEFKLRSFLGSSDQTNAISGRIKKGKDTIAVVDGYWDGKIDIKDKKTGQEQSLLDVAVLKSHRLTRFLVGLDCQKEHESQLLWLKVSEAINKEDQIAATKEKTVIEEGQRQRARNLVAPWVPRFFHQDKSAARHHEGIVDQGWVYNYCNPIEWQMDDVIEYETDHEIKTICSAGSARASVELRRDAATSRAELAAAASRHLHRSDSDRSVVGAEGAAGKRIKTKTLKSSLYAIDSALRDQTLAIERLSKTVDNINESQRQAAAVRPQNIGRVPGSAHAWDLFAGFVLALLLQALLNWIFYHKD